MKKYLLLFSFLIVLSLTSCGRGKNAYDSLEDEVISRSISLQEKYGKIENDVAYAFCDGEYKYLILYYYGIGKNADEIGNTVAIYKTSLNGETEIKDPLDDLDDEHRMYINLEATQLYETYIEYKNEESQITYEQYINGEKGYLSACFASNEKLREND